MNSDQANSNKHTKCSENKASWISGWGQDIYKMPREHLDILDTKQAIKDVYSYVKSTQEPI